MRRLGEGREAEVFEWRDGTVLRLFREGRGQLLDTEEAALRAARAGGFRVPDVHERHSVDGRAGLVVERIDGNDQMTLIGRQPWRVRSLARELGRVHATMHTVEAPAEIVPVTELLRGRIVRAPHLPTEMARSALRALDELPEGDRLLHGDFHPGNVLVSPTGPVVIDWTNAARGDPDADVARTRLMMELGAMPPGTPWLVRSFDRLGRGWFRRTYLRSYRRARPFDSSMVQRWMVPHAAARLAEHIPEEVDALLRFLRGRLDRM